MRKVITAVLAGVCVCCTIMPAAAQDNVGLPFLKIGVGARQASMGSAFTGVSDDIYSLFWNPGGLGHIRRWQWSAAYNRWFGDMYQATFAYAGQVRLLGSRKTAVGVAATYVGMPSWDATGGVDSPVQADHTTAVVSVGQRLDWISPWISIGANLRYISSVFDIYSTAGVAGDLGLLVKTPRFALNDAGMGVFDYGILRAGVSMQHVGGSMTFSSRAAYLPRTARAGLSLLMGRYKTASLLVSGEYIKVSGRDAVVAAGGEFWWHDVAAVRAGYQFNGDDLGGLTFGFGFRWDDVFRSILGLPSKYGDAMSIDLASAAYGDVLNQTYRGAVSHYPVAPEPFSMDQPLVESSIVATQASQVYLTWEKAYDPDPFDDVGYYILIDKDMARVKRAVKAVSSDLTEFLESDLCDSLFVCEPVDTESYRGTISEGGIYYWAVAAYDRAAHVRIAKRGIHRVFQFVVATYDIAIDSLQFEHSRWITTDPLQGEVSFTIANRGIAQSSGFEVYVTDRPAQSSLPPDTVFSYTMGRMEPDEDTTFTFLWNTARPGLHELAVSVDQYSDDLELEKQNNRASGMFVSIPKGTLSAADTVEVMATGYETTEIPVVPEVYFPPFSIELDSCFYLADTTALPVLTILSDRLKRHRDVHVTVSGHIDALSGEKDRALADERSRAVRDKLVALGVDPGQIDISTTHKDKVLGNRRMPADSMDAIWVMQQNRKVSFNVAQQYQYDMFKPITVEVDTTIRESIPFYVDVLSPGEVTVWRINGAKSLLTLSSAEIVSGMSLNGMIQWDGSGHDGSLVPRDTWIKYHLIVGDTLGRTFMTRIDSIYLKEKRTIRRREIFGAAKFAKTEPVYRFYWDRLMDIGKELVENSTMRLRFEGHACAIGPEPVNLKLSRQRAQRFTEAFKTRLKRNYPGVYQSVLSRIDPPVGFGESDPLKVKLKGKGLVTMGDNGTPTGRYLNRRIMVLLYIEH